MKRALLVFLCAAGLSISGSAAPYEDRFVWVFGWNLNRDADTVEVSKLLDTAGQHGCNGAIVSFDLDTLRKKSPEYFERLGKIRQSAERNKIELTPSVFSVGYGGAALSHNRNLAEGLPVANAPFLVHNGEARLIPDEKAQIVNGGFEEFDGKRNMPCCRIFWTC